MNETIELIEPEIWRPIPGYEGLYSSSSLGRIRSEMRTVVRSIGKPYIKPAAVMKPGAGVKSKYLSVRLSGADGTTTHYVHALVLRAFVGEAPQGHETCHRDGDRQNNSVDNLRWGTRKSNHEDKREHGTAPIGINHPMAKLNDAQVLSIRRRRARGMTFREIADAVGVSVMTVHRAVSGKGWSHIK